MLKLVLGLIAGLLVVTRSAALCVRADSPVVHAVMFYSPSCGHCHHVMETALPPLEEQYGAQVEILTVNIAEESGYMLFETALEQFAVPENRRGVPLMIIGETVLVGSLEIPEQLPGLVATHLEQGGLDWPALAGLTELVPEESAPLPAEEGWQTRFARDPLGNGISTLVLVGMLLSVVYNAAALISNRAVSDAASNRWQWAVPCLVALGLVVAGYLAYVETQQVTAICGPVGDCNAVQQSDYALLFGFLPIAVLGVMGYLAIGAAWLILRLDRGLWADLARMAIVGMAWFGVLFSIYLTFLEPFVIGATCAWCLTSAVLMTLLFWTVMPLVRASPGLRQRVPAA